MNETIYRLGATPVTPRRQLSRAEFEQICFEAAKGNTGCAVYINIVLVNLCTLLGLPETPESLLTRRKTDSGNVQAAVARLYFLLEQKCECDFDVAEVLNSYAADSGWGLIREQERRGVY
jgi:hypothetical protein